MGAVMTKEPDVHNLYDYLNDALDDYFPSGTRSQDETSATVIAMTLILSDILACNDSDVDREKMMEIINQQLHECTDDLLKEGLYDQAH
jgi:hypothetical protein